MEPHVDLKPKAMSLEEAGRYVGIGKTTLYRLIKEKKIESVKIGRRTVVLVAGLDAFIEALSQRAA